MVVSNLSQIATCNLDHLNILVTVSGITNFGDLRALANGVNSIIWVLQLRNVLCCSGRYNSLVVGAINRFGQCLLSTGLAT